MKKLFIILFVGFLFLFAGCDSNSSSDGPKTDGYNLDGTYNGGDTGISMEFSDGQPPKTIRDGGLQPFTIRAMVTNKGEHDIPEGDGHIVISGVNPSDFNIGEPSKELPFMRGVKKQGDNVIDGSIQPIIFSNLKYLPELPSGTLSQKISLDVCYPYQTNALVSLCVSGSTLQTFDDDLKVCDVEGDRGFANSGAPVVIDNVKQTPAGSSSVMIQFDIVHDKSESSNGRVYRLGTLNDNCKVNGYSVSSTDATIYEDYVKYTVTTGIDGLDCSGTGTNTGEVLLSDDKTTVYCTQDTSNQEDYERAITITLDYDYFDRINTSVEIQHISQ